MLRLDGRLDPAFARADERFDLAECESERSVIFGLLPSFQLGYVNPAWATFARANGGGSLLERWTLGAPILDAISGPPRRFYEAWYVRALDEQKPWEHHYDCSSPTETRDLWMRVFPLSGDCLLVVNTVAFARTALPGDTEARYVNGNGLAVQCSHCRRVRRADGSEHWDWVALFAFQPNARVTHGLCPSCFAYHYPP